MLSNRPYAPARTPHQALNELRTCARTQFDPAVVTALHTEITTDSTTELAA